MTKTQITEILRTEWNLPAEWFDNLVTQWGWSFLESEAKRITKTKAAGHKGECFEDGARCICGDDKIEDEEQ